MEDKEVKAWYYEKRAEALIKNLEKKNFKAEFHAGVDNAREAILAAIPDGATVALTGSQTMEQIGVKTVLLSSNRYQVINPYEPGLAPAESLERRRQGLLAQVMISSSNALTENGCLVNVDGMGNRCAGMIFGPEKVILAVGMNKVAPNVPAAMERMRTVARPMNNKRLGLPNPCTETGTCADCAGKSRICNYFTIIERCYIKDRIHVVLIGQDLGY